jgi:hypothetical protein
MGYGTYRIVRAAVLLAGAAVIGFAVATVLVQTFGA